MTDDDVNVAWGENLGDALAGMLWFRGLSDAERTDWLRKAGPQPWTAWELFKRESMPGASSHG